MKKRIMSFLLSVVMLLGVAAVFASCSSGNILQITESDPKAQTIVMSILKDPRTTDAAIAAVQQALNEITEAEFNTHIILKAYTEDEYADKILEQSERRAAAQEEYEEQFTDKYGYVNLPDSEKAGDRRKYDQVDNVEYITAANGDTIYYDPEYNKPITMYPLVDDDQLDIIFINNLDLYYALTRNQYVIALGNDLSNTATSKTIRMNTNETVLARATLLGNGEDPYGLNATYAIPNNYYVPGETYILVNKKLYDYYGYSIDCNIHGIQEVDAGCDDFADFISFLYDVAEGNEAMKEIDEDLCVDLVLYNFDDLEWVSCMCGDDGRKSAVMITAQQYYNPDTSIDPDSIYNNALYKKTMNTVSEMKLVYGKAPHIGPCFYRATEEENGYAAPAAKMSENEESFALAIVTGDQSVKSYYDSDDYYVINTAPPTVTNQMFSSMFAISTFSSTAMDADGLMMRAYIDEYDDQTNPRCMEIICALQSDKRFVNLLTYGVRNYNYDIYDNEGTNMVHNMGKNGYYPIVGKAGNLYLTYPNDQMSEEELYLSADEWKACYNQKLLVSPYCGMRLSNIKETYKDVEYTAQMCQEDLFKFYDEHREKIYAFNGYDDNGNPCTMTQYIESIQKELRSYYAFQYYDGASFQRSKGSFMYTPKVDNYAFFLLVYRQSSFNPMGEDEDEDY